MSQSIKVYQAISAITKEMSQEGIAKGRKNQQQGYSFRGIDEVLNALSPMLAKHSLCVLPRMISRESVERQTKNGGAVFYVTVHAEFDFVSAEDGSKHTVSTYGEAMDSGDKATNKAMSAAYKYAAFQAFCIPTEGDNDADATTHEVAPKGLAPERKAELIDLINSALIIDNVKGFNEMAKKECSAVGDEAAYKEINKAAKKRAEQLKGE